MSAGDSKDDTSSLDPASLILPERARLLHIGVPKTGTTALQHTAARRRQDLNASGVLYPPTLTERFDHLFPVASLMGRKLAETDAVPGREHWEALMRHVARRPADRIWITHEWISESDDEQAQRFREELGERLHVVISVRHYGTILTSTWQEFLKSTMLHEFESWLGYVLTDREASDARTRWQARFVERRASQGEIVDRWARIVGPENVTVVVVDPSHRERLTDAFEGMLGLESGFLRAAADDANRSMTVEEASMMLELNRAYADPDTPLTKRAGRMPMSIGLDVLARTPGADERKLTLPRWAAEIADKRSREQADQIARVGARVVGDLDALRVPSQLTDNRDHNRALTVPIHAAVRASIGISREERKRAAVEQARLADDRGDAECRAAGTTAQGIEAVPALDLLRFAAARGVRRVLREARGGVARARALARRTRRRRADRGGGRRAHE